MSTLALLALLALGAAVGILAAWLAHRWAQEDARMTADLAELDAQVDAERARRHQAGIHIRRGGRGDCVVCGARCPYGVVRPGA